ncbi:MAG TPA: hypothetical protein VMT42_02625 [candidate division Zixibacteria bacterium]|nr:hypothetical protein [candidate division Zixibacteria bacterium]
MTDIPDMALPVTGNASLWLQRNPFAAVIGKRKHEKRAMGPATQFHDMLAGRPFFKACVARERYSILSRIQGPRGNNR